MSKKLKSIDIINKASTSFMIDWNKRNRSSKYIPKNYLDFIKLYTGVIDLPQIYSFVDIYGKFFGYLICDSEKEFTFFVNNNTEKHIIFELNCFFKSKAFIGNNYIFKIVLINGLFEEVNRIKYDYIYITGLDYISMSVFKNNKYILNLTNKEFYKIDPDVIYDNKLFFLSNDLFWTTKNTLFDKIEIFINLDIPYDFYKKIIKLETLVSRGIDEAIILKKISFNVSYFGEIIDVTDKVLNEIYCPFKITR